MALLLTRTEMLELYLIEHYSLFYIAWNEYFSTGAFKVQNDGASIHPKEWVISSSQYKKMNRDLLLCFFPFFFYKKHDDYTYYDSLLRTGVRLHQNSGS